jgi:hypothetical protein
MTQEAGVIHATAVAVTTVVEAIVTAAIKVSIFEKNNPGIFIRNDHKIKADIAFHVSLFIWPGF